MMSPFATGNLAEAVTVSVGFPPDRSAARRLIEALGPFLSRWRAAGPHAALWLLWKTPGLRLRVNAGEPATWWPALGGVLQRLKRRGTISSYALGPYEPECWQFGGPEAWPQVARYFWRDTCAFLDWFRRADRPGARQAARALSRWALNDLFTRAAGSDESAVQCWTNLARLHGWEHPEAPEPPQPTEPHQEARDGNVSAALRARYLRANGELAEGLRELQRTGRLAWPLPAILPFVAMFHLNRYAFGRADREVILFAGGRSRVDQAGSEGGPLVVHSALAVRRGYAEDYGRTRTALPDLVVRASQEQDVLAAVALARRRGLPLVVRGAGHSLAGQTLLQGGLVLVNYRESADGEIQLNDDGTVEVSARCRWLEVERFLNGQGRSMPVLTNYLGLTVGGTLSVGGYGERSIQRGPQIRHVERLRLVLPDGTPVWCSRDERPDLFRMALAGLGQVGVIERVRMRTVALPNRTLFLDYTFASPGELAAFLSSLVGEPASRPDTFFGHIPWRDGAPDLVRARLGFDLGADRRGIPLPSSLVGRTPLAATELAPGTAIARDAFQIDKILSGAIPFDPAPRSGRRLWADHLLGVEALPTFLAAVSSWLTAERCEQWLQYMLLIAVSVDPADRFPFEASASPGPGPVKFLFGTYFTLPDGEADGERRIRRLFAQALELCAALGGRPYLYGCPALDERTRVALYGVDLQELRRLRRRLDASGRFCPEGPLVRPA